MYGKSNPCRTQVNQNEPHKTDRGMIVRFDSTLYLVDPYVQYAFAEIVNAIVSSTTPAQMHRHILRLCTRPECLNPNSYFRWGFEGSHFWIEQRLGYKVEAFFSNKLLTVLHYTPEMMLPTGS